MNSAKRLENIVMVLLQTPKDKPLLNGWMNVFETDDILVVYSRLIALNNELERFTYEVEQVGLKQTSVECIGALYRLITHPNLHIQMQNVGQWMSGKPLLTLSLISDVLENAPLKDEHYYSEEDISLDDFVEQLEGLMRNIEGSDLDDTIKTVFLSFLSDLQKGTRLYKINGIDALINTLKESICKYKNIEEDLPSRYSSFKEKASYLVGEIGYWAKTLRRANMNYRELKKTVGPMLEYKNDDVEDTEIVDED